MKKNRGRCCCPSSTDYNNKYTRIIIYYFK
nr:MAG TPA: hypothetical protein [Caudoviricetes sp.]